MANEPGAQYAILKKILENQLHVQVFTINGYQMKGRVTAYDGDTIVLQDADKQMIVYKSAVSTIIPETPVEL